MKEKVHEREWFYTATPRYEQVDKKTFVEFIKQYPRKLVGDVYGVCDPPLITYNDFALANRWPYSIMAQTYGYDDDPNGYFYEPEEKREYYIVVNHEELFESKTGNEA